MKTAYRSYLAPVVVTALMVLGLTFWAAQTWRGLAESGHERQRQRAFGIFDTFAVTIRSLGQESNLQDNQIEKILNNVIQDSPVSFIILELRGKRVIQAGDAPDSLVIPTAEGESVDTGTQIIWRKILPLNIARGDDMERPETILPEKTERRLGDGDQLMIMGIKLRADRRIPRRAMQNLMITIIAALLFITASFIAWVMAIRGRLLTEQLTTERARHTYLEELGLAAAGLAHETKNPLGIILGIAQQIISVPGEPKQSLAMLEKIIDEVDKATARLGHFMTYARQRHVKAAPLNAGKVGKMVADILQSEFKSVGVTLEMHWAPLRILADEEMLRQILVNLLLNSLHASSPGARVMVRFERHADGASLVVEDQGAGIPEDLLPHIFKPYVAGDHQGHGLGLAIVKHFVEDHGWSIRVDSQLGRGTVVVISGIKLSANEEVKA